MSLRLAPFFAFIFALSAASAQAQGDAKNALVVKIDPSALPAHARARLGQLGGYRYTGPVAGAAMSLDGKLIAVSTNNNAGIKIFDSTTGKIVQSLQTQFIGGQSGMSFSADGSTFASQTFQDVRVWDLATGKQLQQLQYRDNFGRAQGPSLSRDGKIMGLGISQSGKNNQTGEVKAVEVGSGKVVGPFEAIHNYNIRVAMAPDGKSMVSFGQNLNRGVGGGAMDREAPRTMQVWDLTAGKEARQIKLDFGPQNFTQVAHVAYSPDGKTLAVVSGTSTFHLIDFATGKETRRFAGLRGNSGGVSSVRFSPDGDILAAYGFQGALQAWEVKTGKRIELDEGPKSQMHAVAFPGKGRIVAMGTVGQALHWWDANVGEQASPFKGHLNPVVAVAFSVDGKSVVSAGSDQAILWWDSASGQETRRLILPDDDARYGGRSSLALSANARFAATAGQNGLGGIRLWNLKTGRIVLDFEGPRNGFDIGLAFSPDGNKLAAADAQSPHLWDITTGQSLLKLPPGNARNAFQPARIAFSPNGKILAVHSSQFDMMGRQSSDLVLWDIEQAKELNRSNRAMPNVGNGLNASGSLAFSPDSRYLAIAEVNGGITLLHASTGREANRLVSANRNSSFQLAFSPDLRFLACGVSPFNPGFGNAAADEPIVEIWELASGQLRDRLSGHTGAITSLTFSPDGATLASGSADTTILLWDFTGKSGPKLKPFTDADLAAAWQSLSAKDAKTAETVRRLVQTPAAVAFLKENFKPAKRGDTDEKRLDKLVADLDNGNFKTREIASRELKTLGERARPALNKGLAGSGSVEARRRMQDLLDLLVRIEASPEELQANRGVEVLERIGTPAARTLLTSLSQGDPLARSSQEAAAAMKRMEGK